MVAGHPACRQAGHSAVTAARHYHAPDGTFRKVLPRDQARRELAGQRMVAELMPVPRLVGTRQAIDGCEIVYEDVFASGRCVSLLADCINTADRDHSHLPAVPALVNQVCDSLLAAAQATGATRTLDECVPDLHAARLAPRGRLDRWYTHTPQPTWVVDGQRLGPADLATRTLVADGRKAGPGWPVDLPELRSALARHTRWVTAITQGDVTEPNICQPLCWLDFEHAGRNALASDTANFLWYLLGMGGWLVPAYQPGVYARTLRAPVPPIATPVIGHLRVTTRSVEIISTWQTGAGRHAALSTLLHRLAGDLGTALAPGGDVTARLRPFLALRILGVISLRQMSGPHAIACLAKLAELSNPAWNLTGWCATVPVTPCPAGDTGSPAEPRIRDGNGSHPKEHHDHSRPRPADHAGR
ncbi:MAG TPA: hypothetical protein VNF47_11225 [Streptosporangiaceae bacterium]|nr:hypothetical protein [Streptosporangiaceae bacterium]